MITVLGPNLIGTVEQNYRLMGVCFTMYNAVREEVGYVEGPDVGGCCMYPETRFTVI